MSQQGSGAKLPISTNEFYKVLFSCERAFDADGRVVVQFSIVNTTQVSDAVIDCLITEVLCVQ